MKVILLSDVKRLVKKEILLRSVMAMAETSC